ncbi:MAG: metallophosphoesterase [Planctomycetota bacterium]
MKHRRQFLLRSAAWIAGAITAGYVGFRVAAHNGWLYTTRNARAFQRGTEPARSIETASLNVLLVGDTGKPSLQRRRVVASMRAHTQEHQVDAAILLGDNFYDHGVASVDDPRFERDFNALFDASTFVMPFYVALGNHDCHQNPDAQVEYTARNPRWTMPSRFYKETLRSSDVTVLLCVIDTSLLLEETPASKRQLMWLRQSLIESDATWKIVAGHHPVLTGGRHQSNAVIATALQPIFDTSAVDFYLSGHDHDLQLLDSQRGWRQIVSGAGSKLRSTSWIDATLFAEACPGFASMALSRDNAYVSYHSEQSRLMTATFAAKARSPITASS